MALRDFILYPLAGALAGVALAFAIARGTAPLPTFDPAAGVFALAGLILAGAVALVVVRRKAPRAAPRPSAKAAPAPVRVVQTGPAPALEIRLPQIAPGYPDVWGAGESLEVVVAATSGAALALSLGGKPAGTARAGDSPVAFSVQAAQPGQSALEVVADVDGRRAAQRRPIRFVRYDEEIQTLYASFREWAVENWPEARNALTARELMAILRPRIGGSAEAIGEATRVFELVAYGGRNADRALYVQVVDALAAIAAAAEPPAGEVAAGA